MRKIAYVSTLLLVIVTAGCKNSHSVDLYIPKEASHLTMRDDHNRLIEMRLYRNTTDRSYYTTRTATHVVPAQIQFMIPRHEIGCGSWSHLNMTVDNEDCALLLSNTPPTVTIQSDGQELLTCNYTVQLIGW